MTKKNAAQHITKIMRDRLKIYKSGTAALRMAHSDWNLLFALLDEIAEPKQYSNFNEDN